MPPNTLAVAEPLLPPKHPTPIIVVVTAGLSFTVITTVDIAAVQGPAPSGSLVVNVRVTVPLVMLGV